LAYLYHKLRRIRVRNNWKVTLIRSEQKAVIIAAMGESREQQNDTLHSDRNSAQQGS